VWVGCWRSRALPGGSRPTKVGIARGRRGDELQLECTLEQVRGPIGKGKARATVDGQLAARGTLTFAVEQS